MLEAALAYGRMGWRVFPLHTVIDGQCSCGKPHQDGKGIAKHPRTPRGFKEATNDSAQIRKWWTRWPDANIGVATGSGLVVIDVDGAAGAAEFKELVAAHGPPPETLSARTGNGFHLIYQLRPGSPEVRSSARGSVHVRGEGGYIVASPSRHASGRSYQWVRKCPVAILPEWLRQWSQGYEIRDNLPISAVRSGEMLGDLPAYLQEQAQISQQDITNTLSETLKTVYSPAEHARLVSALAAIPSNSYEIWYQTGMALKTLDWERSDGSSIAFELFDEWSQTCPDKYSLAGTEDKWRSFGRRAGITLGTVFHLAQQHGWNGGAPEPTASLNGAHAFPAAFVNAPQTIFWPDRDDEGRAKATCTNVGVAVKAMGINCRKDLFHGKMLVAGEPINQWAGDMSDEVIQMIRKTIRYRFGFDPKTENTRDACTQLCLENQFNPVCDYLDTLIWDGTPRLEKWLVRYMSAADTELNRAIGRLTLIAAVRRAYAPGTKFDQIIVLEGAEGRGKSTAIEILAGKDNFSDQKILGLSDKEQQEAMSGIWLYEIAELTGMKRAETEHVKAFASRTTDRARPAWGRFRVDRPRTAVCFATTNDDEYLKSQTGNRRFWPVMTGTIDLAALKADRDQLWAEAAEHEARGASIVLPQKLWKTAESIQEDRLETDEWAELINNYLNLKNPPEFGIMDVLTANQFLQLLPSQVGRAEQMRATGILKRLGYEKVKRRDGNRWRKVRTS